LLAIDSLKQVEVKRERAIDMVKHHLMIGTWTPPGVIITVSFDDETLELELVKKTEIPEDEPISWMAFDVRTSIPAKQHQLTRASSTSTARQ
jgi:hypothetical protein